MIMPAVIWCDPGGMTGIAALTGHGTRFFADEYGFEDACRQVEAACHHYGRSLAVGWERYDINTRLPQKDAHLVLEMIGVIRWCARKNQCVILEPAQQHTPKGHERLELQKIGWWVKGKNDAQSAAWHMLAWLRKTGQLPPRERAILS
jgi:DNA-directed RNA polymerase subunit N (RpoN/RPB10)